MRPTDKTKRNKARFRLVNQLLDDALENLERFDPPKARAIRANIVDPVDKERDQLAADLQALRTANSALADRVKRLEAAGDAMAMAEGCQCDGGIICKRCFERQNAWMKARNQP